MFSPTSSEAFSSPSPRSVLYEVEDLAFSSLSPRSTPNQVEDSAPLDCPTFMPSNQPEYVKGQLERLSMQAVDLIADKRFTSPLLRCFSPNLKSVYEGVTINTGRDSIFSQLAQASEQYPDWRTEAVDALAEGTSAEGHTQ